MMRSYSVLVGSLAFMLASVASGVRADPPPRRLLGPGEDFRLKAIEAHGVTPSLQGTQLRLDASAGDLQGSRRRVVFPLRGADRDLSRYRHVEVEIANVGSVPVTFSFWALSGPGWGGVSTFSTTRTASGRESLAAGAREVFRIDLHARYSGPAVYTPAVDPAAIRQLELVLEPAAAPLALSLGPVQAAGQGPTARSDAPRRIHVPDVERAAPAAGRRVYQQLPGWEHTEVSHVLSLPREWRPGQRYPVIIEYTGNVFYHKFCHSTGRTDQGNLAHGLARGETFICLNLPFISEDGRREQVDGWGDIKKTADYCLAALRFVENNFGGDRRAVFYTGFSRGSYAANYLALRDDPIAAVWAGFLTLHDPAARWPEGKTRGWRGIEVGWNDRAARMGGRPWFYQPPELGPEVHVDVEFLEDRPSTVATRRWLHDLAAQRLATPSNAPRQ